MTTAIVCTALLEFLLFLLGLGVSAARGGAATGAYPNDPADPFFKRIRAHGNTAEYAPMMAVLMLLVGSRNQISPQSSQNAGEGVFSALHWRLTDRKRLARKLKELRVKARRAIHAPVAVQHAPSQSTGSHPA